MAVTYSALVSQNGALLSFWLKVLAQNSTLHAVVYTKSVKESEQISCISLQSSKRSFCKIQMFKFAYSALPLFYSLFRPGFRLCSFQYMIIHFVSFRFVSFRFISFRFVSSRFAKYSKPLHFGVHEANPNRRKRSSNKLFSYWFKPESLLSSGCDVNVESFALMFSGCCRKTSRKISFQSSWNLWSEGKVL